MASSETPRSVLGSGSAGEDLLTSAAAPERADAARNRRLILAAAAKLFAHRDPRQVTMDEVAHAAGVGRATLYRRYPNVRAIAVALLDEHERDLQQRLLGGDPPLGPGCPPEERLAAFFQAITELLERFLPLLLGAETGAQRFATGAYGFWHAHVRALLAEAGSSDPDPRADLLLAAVDPEFYQYQRSTLSPEQISEHLAWLAHRTLTAP